MGDISTVPSHVIQHVSTNKMKALLLVLATFLAIASAVPFGGHHHQHGEHKRAFHMPHHFGLRHNQQPHRAHHRESRINRELEKRPCLADAYHFCTEVQDEHGTPIFDQRGEVRHTPSAKKALRMCLFEHSFDLSEECRAHHPCMQDMERLCPTLVSDWDKNQLKRCLFDNAGNLTAECKVHHPCTDDIHDKCMVVVDSGTPKLGPAIRVCLVENAHNLSAICSAQHPCIGDIHDYCRDTEAKEKGADMKCLFAHMDKLSPQCLMAHPCAADMQMYCRGVSPDMALHCLFDQAEHLSPKCRRTHPCAQDVEKFCEPQLQKGVQKEIHQCLIQHRHDLSHECKSHHAKLGKLW